MENKNTGLDTDTVDTVKVSEVVREREKQKTFEALGGTNELRLRKIANR